jgi:hypothetical protein
LDLGYREAREVFFFVLSGREEPEVQWAMIFTAGWTGVYDEKYRERCMQIGEKNGALQNEKVPRGCTLQYLPAFIAIEEGKRQKHEKNCRHGCAGSCASGKYPACFRVTRC